jgi:hypothetical protein
MLFAIVNKETLEIDKLTRDENEAYDQDIFEKIQVGNYDTKSEIKFIRDENGTLMKCEYNAYAFVRRDNLQLEEVVHETEYKGHDDSVFARITLKASQIDELGLSTLVFNPDFTFYSDPNKLTNHEGFKNIRIERDRLLSETDWMVGNDTPLSEEQLIAIKEYRQKLRDITKGVHPREVVFPTKPI